MAGPRNGSPCGPRTYNRTSGLLPGNNIMLLTARSRAKFLQEEDTEKPPEPNTQTPRKSSQSSDTITLAPSQGDEDGSPPASRLNTADSHKVAREYERTMGRKGFYNPFNTTRFITVPNDWSFLEGTREYVKRLREKEDRRRKTILAQRRRQLKIFDTFYAVGHNPPRIAPGAKLKRLEQALKFSAL